MNNCDPPRDRRQVRVALTGFVLGRHRSKTREAPLRKRINRLWSGGPAPPRTVLLDEGLGATETSNRTTGCRYGCVRPVVAADTPSKDWPPAGFSKQVKGMRSPYGLGIVPSAPRRGFAPGEEAGWALAGDAHSVGPLRNALRNHEPGAPAIRGSTGPIRSEPPCNGHGTREA